MARRITSITLEEFANNFDENIKNSLIKTEADSNAENVTFFKLEGTNCTGKLYRNGPLDFYRINISSYKNNKKLFDSIVENHWIDEGEDGNIYIREIYRPTNSDFKSRMERLNNTLKELMRIEGNK